VTSNQRVLLQNSNIRRSTRWSNSNIRRSTRWSN